MAWTALTYAFGSLLTSTKMTQLFDNFASLAAGDLGAPDIITNALGGQISGSFIIATNSTERQSTTTATPQKLYEFKVGQGGIFKLTFSHKYAGGSGNTTAFIYVDNAQFGSSINVASTAYVEVSVDVTVPALGLLQIYAQGDNGALYTLIDTVSVSVGKPIEIGDALP